MTQDPQPADEVLAEVRDDGVLLLTLNRPDRLNAWTRTMQRRYFDLLEEADRDPRVRVVVVTGAGRGFCAGADMAALSEVGPEDFDPDERPLSLATRMRKPVIAAINGPVAGVGLVVALFTDVRFAASEAKFTTAFSKRGLIAEYGIAWLLPKLVGVGKALDLLLSARTLLGTEAGELGLVDRVVPGDQVLGSALAYARTLATECSPASMAEIKQQVYTGLDSGLETATADATERMIAAFRRPDVKEGIHSYLERRAPRFPPLDGSPGA
ncbi:enoyl-CoA hydratase [Saccharopolyspora erythraea NRRL 2338]|uniref:Enoyl-CoA hydratase/isomerase n=2 Tax=Saccharopolyspora erythraea TaxID=1836 RepID=A4FGG4_SACEN|nr:enoyl-CoA hydratase-related protein [Saccharopolyspora erythraea]EQD83952.1 enoyl-CoA hydratase [Saccharopolyspora erythraea D]PFG96844.1 enoyl-CoA hydratase [Saccharopolyspora erythraea NRRL 2338]QRK87083.1 enoyl-CoA hydratase/isomerase family protein [Saccharopolyspora erythraea]CAM03139.1 enoyl-CoA hydratase/isomerase [Saccharopolyspora erythraea NRRL 2338]